MKQIIQNLNNGETILEIVPVPQVRRGCVLIKSHSTLVSLGTEKMLVQFGKSNLIEKARAQPDKVKQVLQKIKSDGLKPTIEAVFRKLNEPLPLGYCQAGEVIAVGEGVTDFAIGDRVASNGQHAEVVCVPTNLVAKIPENVTYEEAAFTPIASIALQGIRLANPTFGETIVVTGLGLIGLIAAQILKSNGCQVIGIDYDVEKCRIAETWGIKTIAVTPETNVVDTVLKLNNNQGVDAVIITASTKSNEVISQSAQMCRKRGRIILIGVIGLDISRADFYEKEISFQVSCSYGPGRYEQDYEQKGLDYPIAFVRWTEKRNFEAILNAISLNQLNVKSLITERVSIDNYNEIYGDMNKKGSIASVIQYSGDVDLSKTSIQITNNKIEANNAVLGIIGAGNFAKATILPNLKKINASVKHITSSAGLSGTLVAKQFGVNNATTNNNDVLNDKEVSAVIITTQHNTHAKLCIQALEAGKHVFVEKPLALNLKELKEVEKAYNESGKTLTVGFNRRFSPFSIDAKKQIGNSNIPLTIIANMNAGFIPPNHWTHDMQVGGGRIIGEACHLIDLCTYFTDSEVESVCMSALDIYPKENTDNASIFLKYKNGSSATINYFSGGNKAYSKERIEIHAQEKSIIIDNFKKNEYFGCKSSGMSGSQDKGHYNQFKLFVENLKNGGTATIPFAQIINTSKAVILAVESMKEKSWKNVS